MKKSTGYTVISILAVIAVSSIIYASITAKRVTQDERYLSSVYQRAFTEFVSDVADVDNTLQKSLLVTSSPMAGSICSELYAKTTSAETSLSSLPFSASEFESTASFLNKTGDYALALSKKTYSGQGFSDEDRENLQALSDVAATLSQNLNSIQQNMGESVLDLKQYKQVIKTIKDSEQGGENAIPKTLAESMSLAEAEFPEVPSLIYDGPFSEHLRSVSPRFLEGKEEIDVSKGRKIAASFLGVREERVYAVSESTGDIPCYYFQCNINDSAIDICVTKTGGVVLSVIGSRLVNGAKLDAEQALNIARDFLENHGYNDMKESYYLISENVLTANFSSVKDDVICYSDLVKVAIALDDGSLMNFDATGYITSHIEREMPIAQITLEQAQEKIIAGLNVDGTNMALIPSKGKKEVLCYEFSCVDANEQKYLIYVNAETGDQEKILILLEDKNGALTV